LNPGKIRDGHVNNDHYFGQDVFVPASNWFVAFSLIAALILNFLPLQGEFLLFRPDFLAITIVYWGISYPHKMGMSVAFGLGLMMDVGNAGILGQHALAYCVVVYLTLVFGRRLRLFTPVKQAPQVGLVLLMMQWAIVLVAVSSGSLLPDCQYFFATVAGALLWVPVSYLFTLLLRQKPDPDSL
jgi:rod shape-determining protein MreD